jgi:DNA repair exonuclease SbcCD nuclease subunit
MTVRFLHTGDWHLGMTRYFLSEGNQERFSQARFDVIRELGKIAVAENCEFMVVCGDVFESNQVDPRTVRLALEALKTLKIPVYLLPGNHDPLDAASVYNSNTFKNGKPDHVHVLLDTNPIRVKENVEIVGAPWLSKHPTHDIFAFATDKLEPDDDIIRICVAHGAIRDKNSPNPDNPVLISVESAEKAISQGRIHYLALGDRHSLTEVGNSGRIWYAGSPEPTSFKEEKPGFALIASVGKNTVSTKELRAGRWRFDMCERIDLNSGEDLKALDHWFSKLEDKEQRVVKLHLVGSLYMHPL